MFEAAISHQPSSSLQNQLYFVKINNGFIVIMFTIIVFQIFYPPLPHEPKLSKYSILSWHAHAEKQKQFCSQRKRMLVIEPVAQRLNVQKLLLFVNLKSVQLQHQGFFSRCSLLLCLLLDKCYLETHFRAHIYLLVFKHALYTERNSLWEPISLEVNLHK